MEEKASPCMAWEAELRQSEQVHARWGCSRPRGPGSLGPPGTPFQLHSGPLSLFFRKERFLFLASVMQFTGGGLPILHDKRRHEDRQHLRI